MYEKYPSAAFGKCTLPEKCNSFKLVVLKVPSARYTHDDRPATADS